MRRRTRWLIVALLLVIIAAPMALLTSETALRAVAGFAAQRIAALEIENVRGRLLTGVSIDRVAWRQPDGVTVMVSGIFTGWQMLPALAGRLYLDTLEADSVVVTLAPAQPVPPDTPPREFTLPSSIEVPLIIRVHTLTVGVVTVERDGDTLFEVEAVDASDLYADPDSFRVGRLAAIGDPASFEFSGTVQPSGSWPTELDARWRLLLPDRPRFDGTLVLAGALDRTVEVDAQANSADAGAAQFTGAVRNLLRAPSVEGRLVITGAQIERWADAAPEALVSADVVLDGWIEDLGIRGSGSVATPDWPRADFDADLHWGHRLLAIREAAARSDDVPTTVDASGHVDWSGDAVVGSVRALWQSLHWPLGDAEGLRSDEGRLTMEFGGEVSRVAVDAHFGEDASGRVRGEADLQWLDGDAAPRIDARVDWEQVLFAGLASDHGRASAQGTADDWAGAIVAAFEPPGLPVMTLSGDATGDSESLRATDVHADWLDGTADGTLEFSWANGWRGSTELLFDRIDPGLLHGDWSGRVGGRLQASLSSVDGDVHWRARLRDSTGTIDGRSFRARALLRGIGADLHEVDGAAAIGSAEATVHGRMAPDFELAWAVSAPDVGILVPGAGGAFNGNGFLRGDTAAPAIEFEVSGEDLVFEDVSIARLSGDGDMDLAGARGTRAVLRVHGLDLGGRLVESTEFTLSGPRDALTASVDAQADLTRIRVRIGGAWADEKFAGTLELASLVHGDEAPWQLSAAVPLSFGADSAHIDQACWQQQDSPNELCVAADWRAGVETRARAGLTGLPLAELSAWLPLGFQYSGRIGGDATLHWPAGAQPDVDVRVAVTDGSWRHVVAGESVALMQWNEASVEGSLRDGNLATTAAFELVDEGQLRATLELPVYDTADGPADGRPLHARLVGEFSDFDLLPALVPDIGSVTGRARADLTVTGTRVTPLFSGTLVLDDGTTTIPRLGIRLTDLGMALEGNRNELEFRANARSGPGTLELGGAFGIQDGRLAGDLRISGTDFEASDVPEARVRISPQLSVGIRGHAVNVDGEVRIPYARLAPRDLTGTIGVSEDEILVDEEEVFGDDDTWRVSARVRFVMGDVEFRGYGLRGSITGSLTAIDTPDQLTRATGELQVQEGRYDAWGQQLEIEYGRLIFTGGPITEPGVDVLAVRRPQGVVVGVNVRGTLREPELRLHSEPAMQQAEQLSWLILGQPLTRATGSEQALLDRTRDTAGLAGGDLVARQLGRQLGLSDVSIDRGDTPDEAALVIGHYLSPRVYIGYGIGIFDPGNSLRLRFHIDNNWSIEAETGDRATSTDLRFTIER